MQSLLFILKIRVNEIKNEIIDVKTHVMTTNYQLKAKKSAYTNVFMSSFSAQLQNTHLLKATKI